MTASDEERVKGAVRLVELRRVSKVVDDYKHLVQFLHFQLLGRFRDLALLVRRKADSSHSSQEACSRACLLKVLAGMQLKYLGSKPWLAPHLDLLGDVSVLHSPFCGSGKLESYLARRRPGLEVRGADTFEPVVNLHRCYLRRDPVFLRSLGARRGQALLLQAPPAGRAEKPCSLPFVVSVNDVPEARPEVGQEQFQARAACAASGQSCCRRRRRNPRLTCSK